MKSIVMLFVVLAATLAGGVSQQKPSPPKEHAAFEKLLGTWVGEISIGPGAGNLKGPAKLKFESAMDGMFLQMELRHDLGAVGLVKGLTLFAWDAKEKKFRSHTFANGGLADPSRPRVEEGTFEDGALTMGSVDSKPGYRQIYRLQADGSVNYSMEMVVDGKATEYARGVLRRKG